MQSWAYNRELLTTALEHLQPRIEVFSDFAPAAAYLVSGMLPIGRVSFGALASSDDDLAQTLKILQFTQWRLEGLTEWQRDALFDTLKALAGEMDLKIRDFLAPLFIAIAGSSASISVMDSMVMLGSDLSRARVRYAIEMLGGVSKKQLKRLDKEYQMLGSTSGGEQ